MKQYFIGFIIGACLVVSAFMFSREMGVTNGKVGKYIFQDGEVAILDTENGNYYALGADEEGIVETWNLEGKF